MSERFVIRDDRGGIWFAMRMQDGARRLMHAPQGKRFWHEDEGGFAEAEVDGVTAAMRAEGRTPTAFVDLDEIWAPPPEPREDPKLARIIDRILVGTPWEKSGAGVLSTSETIVVALATGRHEMLPTGYHDPCDAWDRLDDVQREIVRRYVSEAEAGYMKAAAPGF